MTEPIAGLLTWATWKPDRFEIQRRQEFSRTASGELIVRDIGPAVWVATFSTTPMRSDDMQILETRMSQLRGSLIPFEAWDLRRATPRDYPSGSGFGNPRIADARAGGGQVKLNNMSSGATVRIGDYLEWGLGGGVRSLHRSTSNVTADGSGETPWIDIEPAAPIAPQINRPVDMAPAKCIMRVEPGSLQVTWQSPFTQSMTFSAIQTQVL